MDSHFIIRSINRLGIAIFLILALIISLFPPFEWNHKYIGENNLRYRDRTTESRHGSSYDSDYEQDYESNYEENYSDNENSGSYSRESEPYKTYSFLFGPNIQKFYSDVTKRNEAFSRSIILSELLVEYLLISFIATLLHLVFIKIDKKRL